ncbi:UDP-N-acetylmuramoyl-tripeptide--D-alanyl-D-alanine ligase [Treponema sp.]|uniref:UDP-N-acetylmuramoyl-tripeptide--D-alanyl-D- alanine ligase n=1 Tax=Treponema sp. TaxID=166 RepID=UPI0025F887EB|nr:UDP-N-acetylmuramoyl-tripeptide--D-alanyl-D-alanine ligase [Treponema sp.]MCR5217186.1 UDP-N-acetylmuramoyl-tripeptide--D-alanyl-D-alanine ligase [Treponema sp.]
MSVKNECSLLELDELTQAVSGIHVLGSGNFYFDSVQTDSRAVVKNTMFVPLIGENQDGHKYVPQAVESGASVVLISLANFEKDGSFFSDISLKHPDVFFIAVENTLTALQKAAGRYVEKFPELIKIGVTGSSGKTTTKEIAAAILRQKYNVITNKGNLNSETGLPLSVFTIRKEHEVGIFEMGMNRENEIGEISAVLKARYGIITNIGTAHIGCLGSRENIAREKAKVFDHFYGIGTAFIPKNDDFASFLADQVDGHVVYYGDGCDEHVKFSADLGLDGTEFFIDGEKAVLKLPGRYNYGNALAAVALAKHLGLSSSQIAAGINSLKGMFGRSEVIKGKYTVIQDCYNANPDSMEKALDFISSVSCSGKKILVLGDMLELGEDSLKEHEKAAVQAMDTAASLVIFAGNEMKAACDKALELEAEKKSGIKIEYAEGCSMDTMKKIGDILAANAGEGDIILVKGSRGMGLERVVKLILGEA